MNIEALKQFAYENDLEFEYSVNKRLNDTFIFSFYNRKNRNAYTYYVGKWELSDVDNHEIIINNIINTVIKELLNK